MPSEEQLVQFLTTLACRGSGSNPWPPVSRSEHSTDWVWCLVTFRAGVVRPTDSGYSHGSRANVCCDWNRYGKGGLLWYILPFFCLSSLAVVSTFIAYCWLGHNRNFNNNTDDPKMAQGLPLSFVMFSKGDNKLLTIRYLGKKVDKKFKREFLHIFCRFQKYYQDVMELKINLSISTGKLLWLKNVFSQNLSIYEIFMQLFIFDPIYSYHSLA